MYGQHGQQHEDNGNKKTFHKTCTIMLTLYTIRWFAKSVGKVLTELGITV